MGFEEYQLKDVCSYSTERIGIENISLSNYISTENLLAEKAGKVLAAGLPKVKTVANYRSGDTLISNIRPYFRKIWYSQEVGGASGDVLIFRPNDEKVYNKYLYYFLSQNEIFDYMVQTSKGTKMPRGDKAALMTYPILLPTMEKQKEIARILSVIDEKIKVNNKIISNLEKLAQTLFKRWFVDFEFPNENGEPYKSSGGEMVESELGMVPEGWEIKALSDLINVIDNRGKTPPLEEESTEFPIIDVKGLSGKSRIIDFNKCMKHVNEETYSNWFRNGHPKKGDILFSTVGSIGSIKLFYGSKGSIAQNVVALRSRKTSPLYLYQYIDNEQERIKTYNIGSVQPSIKITHFIKKKILIPKEYVEREFHEILERVSSEIYLLSRESITLTNLRDTLLPKLLSGEIVLSDETEVK